MAAVWHRQPDAGGDRANSGDSGPVQDEAPALRMGNDSTDVMAADLHADGRMGEAVRRQSEGRVPDARGNLRVRTGGWKSARSGEEYWPDVPDRIQRLYRCRDGRGIHR